jgi:hypothetical protein
MLYVSTLARLRLNPESSSAAPGGLVKSPRFAISFICS